MKGVKSHQIVEDGLSMLENLTHRGAVGADPLMGDGAGVLVQIPDRFFREEMAKQGVELPPPGHYGVGHLVHAAGRGAARAHRRDHREVGAVRRPAVARLPRRAGRQFLALQGAGYRGVRAVPSPGVHRPRRRDRRRRGVRARGSISCARSSPAASMPRTNNNDIGSYMRVAVGAHHRLQGHVPRLPGRRLLQGPRRSALRDAR